MNAMPVRILLMEDDPGDVELILEALRGSRVALSVERVGDGEEGKIGRASCRERV